MIDQIVTVAGTLLGVVVGLLGGRWARTLGKVQCAIRWWSARFATARSIAVA